MQNPFLKKQGATLYAVDFCYWWTELLELLLSLVLRCWIHAEQIVGDVFLCIFDAANNHNSQYLLNSYYVPQTHIISFKP